MAVSDNRLIVRLNDQFSGPLKTIPGPHRKVVAQSVAQGRVVENPADALTAIAYAQWLGRRYRWSGIAFAVAGLALIVANAIIRDWFQFGLGVLFVGLGVFYGWSLTRIRHSASLNEAMAS